MAKTRLTNADRDVIRVGIIDHKFLPIEAALLAEENALAVQARIKAYGEYLPTIEAAPAGAFPEERSVRLNIGGRKIALRFGDGYRVAARVFDKHTAGYDRYLLSLTDTDAFAKKALSWAERAEAAKAERRKLVDSVSGTLSAFRSFDDLLKGWPEADKFITARWRTRPEYSANVPAVAIQDLSAALDLPPEIAEAA